MVCFQTHIFGSMYSYLYPITKCKWLDKCMPTGYTIPFGWAIMLVNSALQLNPNIYKDPLAFNPWRWKVCDYNLVRRNEWSNQYYCCLFREIPLTTFFFFFFFYKWNQDLDPLVVSKNFVPFGRGIRQCAGAEYTKAFMATFLHVLVTKYR